MPYIVTTLPGTGRAFDDEDEARDYALALDRCGIDYTIKFPKEWRGNKECKSLPTKFPNEKER